MKRYSRRESPFVSISAAVSLSAVFFASAALSQTEKAWCREALAALISNKVVVLTDIPRFLADADLSSLAWRKAFVRSLGNENEVDPEYIRLHSEAMLIFDQWFREPGEAPGFMGTLRETHLVAGRGVKGTDQYAGKNPLRKGDSYDSKQVPLGIFRHEINDRQQDDLMTNFDETVAIDWGVSVREKQGSGLGGKVRIEGIPEDACPTNLYFANRPQARHHYPAARFVPFYLNRMDEVLTKIKEFRDQREQMTPTDRAKVVQFIADYYHVGINGLPFKQINNSLLMGQANYLLQYFGLKPIYHGKLDFAAYALPTPQFRQVFMNAVAEENAGAGVPISPAPRAGFGYFNGIALLRGKLTRSDSVPTPRSDDSLTLGPPKPIPFLQALWQTPLPASDVRLLENLNRKGIHLQRTAEGGIGYSRERGVILIDEDFLMRGGQRELSTQELEPFLRAAREALLFTP